MTLINDIYYFSLLFIIHTKYICTHQCHHCVTKSFHYLVTIDNLPYPTEDDCHVITATHGCYIHIDWLADGTSEVYYTINPTLPYNSISTMIERQVILDTGIYSTRQSIGYSCKSNKTSCNTIDHLKGAVNSITFPTNEQIKQFDRLITPTKNFNASLCAQVLNTVNCSQTNLTNCQQCMSIAQYSEHIDICRACPTEKLKRNFVIYYTIFHINILTRSEEIRIACQTGNACNSIDNIEQIKRTLMTKLNLKTFYRSTTSTTKSTDILLFMIVITELVRLAKNEGTIHS